VEQDQKLARIFGVRYLVTFVTSIPALALYQSILDDPASYITGGGKDGQIYLAQSSSGSSSSGSTARSGAPAGLADPGASAR